MLVLVLMFVCFFCLFLLRAGLALGDGVRCLTGGVSSWGARSSWATTMGMDHVYSLLFSIWKVALFIWGGRGDREPFGPPCQVFPGFSAIMVVVAVQGPLNLKASWHMLLS